MSVTEDTFRNWAALQQANMDAHGHAMRNLTEQMAVIAKTLSNLQSNANTNTGGSYKSQLERVMKLLVNFKGVNFSDWKWKTRNMMTQISPMIKEFFDLVDKAENDIDDEDLFFYKYENKEMLKDISKNVYYILAQKTDDEPLVLVKNVTEGNGAAAWQKLVKRYDGKSMGKQVHLLRKAVNPGRTKKLSGLLSAINDWEHVVLRLSQEYDVNIEKELKIGILLELLPVDVTEIMVQRIEKEDDYKTVKEKVMRYVEQREEFGGIFPMDCSHIDDVDQSHMDGNNHNNLNHGTDEEINWIGKGTKGGKGGKGFTGQCHTCGEFGHKASQCPQKNACWICGDVNHHAANCTMNAKGKGKKGDYKGTGKGNDAGKGKGWTQQPHVSKGKGWFGKAKGKGNQGKNYGYPSYMLWADEMNEFEDSEEYQLFGLSSDISIKQPKQIVMNPKASKAPCPQTCMKPMTAVNKNDQIHDKTKEQWKTARTRSSIPRSGEPMRINLLDHVKPNNHKLTKIFNHFEALTCDEEETEEENLNPLDEIDELGIPSAEALRPPSSQRYQAGYRQNRAARERPQDRCQQSKKKFLKPVYEQCKDGCAEDKGCVQICSLFEADIDIGHLQQEKQWVRIESVMDSGAAESVAPADLAPWIDAVESEGSRRGQMYVSASGDRLPNLGEKKLRVITEEGHPAVATFQLADVTRPLCSISKVCDRGNTVTFHATGGYITSATGEQTEFRRQNNVYVLDMYMKSPKNFEGAGAPGFSRPSR